MKEYRTEIHKDFRKLNYISAPFNKLLFPISNFVINLLPKCINKKKMKIDKFYVNSKDKTHNIKVYCIYPKDLKESKKALIYFHGGGFVYKAAFMQYKLCEIYSQELNMKVFIVDYRLAPKHLYPIPIEDCIDAYRYIVNNKNILEIGDEIMVGGDSAGGNLAIEVVHQICKNYNDHIKPKKMMLIYPVIDRDLKTNSKLLFDKTPVWNSKKNKKMWEYYTKGKNYMSKINEDVDNLPKIYIETCEFDPLRDEGLEYGNKNNAIINCTKGTVHGYDICLKSEITKQNIMKRINFLKDN